MSYSYIILFQLFGARRICSHSRYIEILSSPGDIRVHVYNDNMLCILYTMKHLPQIRLLTISRNLSISKRRNL